MIFLKNNNTLLLLISIIFSYIFVFIIPWTNWVYFVDIDFYMDRIGVLFTYGLEGDITKNYTGAYFLFSEVLWYFLLVQLPFLFNDIQTGLSWISFTSLLVYSFYTFRHSNILISSILLLNPIFIDLIMSQIRIAFAFAILLLAYMLIKKSKILSTILVLISFFIHTASFLLVAIYLFIFSIKKIIKDEDLLFKMMIILPSFIVFFMSFLVLPILDFFGDSGRVVYFTGQADVSTVFFSIIYLGFSVLIAFLPKKKTYLEVVDIIAYSIFMGSLFFGLSLVQLYGSRFVAIAFPFFIIAIDKLKSQPRFIVYSLLFIYQLIYLSYWVRYS